MNTILTEASLYPTKPIANTTYIAGQAALVTWIEDGAKPFLASLGRMKIDLYAGHNVSSGKLNHSMRSSLFLVRHQKKTSSVNIARA